jgi:hypothetical protein
LNKLKILSCAEAVVLTGFVEIAWAVGANGPVSPHVFRHILLGKLVKPGVNQTQKQRSNEEIAGP